LTFRSKTSENRLLKHLARLAGISVTIACGVYFVVVVIDNAAAFPVLTWNGPTIGGLAMATALLLAMMVSGGLAWHIALGAMGEPPKLRAAISTVLLPQIAKYLPGNVAHVVGRVALARLYGVALPRVALAMTFEVGWSIIAAAGVATAALLAEGPRLSHALPRFPAGGIALVIAAALAAPAVGSWVLGRWRPGSLARFLGNDDIALPGMWPTLACVVIYSASFAIGGLALDILAQGPLAAQESRYVLMTGVFAAAWVVGYVMPGAPAGVGVREAILVASLGPIYGEATAVALALILRACSIVVDGLAFLIGMALRRSLTKG